MKAIWNILFIPALVVALGFSAAMVQADEKSSTGSSHGSSQQAGHQSSSPAKTTSGKTSSTPAKTNKTSSGMKKDNASAGKKKTTNTKKESNGSKSTTSTSKKESPWGGNKKDSDWGGYGGTGSTTDNKGKTDSKTKPSNDNKGSASNKKESPWGDQTGKGSKSTKTSTGDHTASSHKMAPCPKEMPKNKTGGHWTQEQYAPKWNSCATYNNWSKCPDQWHVKFNNTYCLPTNYCFWQKKYFDARCGCYTYYDSYSSGWYYYEPVVKCYIPVSYCEQYEVERTESLEEVDVCEVEVPACETVRNYRVLPVKPACAPYTHGYGSR